MRQFIIIGPVVLLSLLSGGAARGETLDEERTKLARVYFDQGAQAMEKERWEEAHSAFLNAWRMRPHWQIGANLGKVELKLSKYGAAAGHLSASMRDVQASTEAEESDRASVRSLFEDARSRVMLVSVRVSGSGTKVFVDGVENGRASPTIDVFLAPGNHRIEARFASCTAAQEIHASADATEQIALECSAPKDSTRTLALITGLGLAGAGFVFGGVAAGLSSSAGSEQRGIEQGADPASQATRWQSLESERTLWGNIAASSFIVGGALGLSGLTYYLASPLWSRPGASGSNSGMTVTVRPSVAGLVVSGAW